ncbi:glycine-rich domain-containing protein [Aliiroseovarius sp. 2305UL8-7]|uniref:glycine-rich domain-containing protein n=1 Tax=Aliiroseovarius conchicola TaxID=3121637 RepID=UPI003528F716
MQNEKLWKAIQAFKFDNAFASSLAKKNRWDSAFTERAIAEYRKFLFLSQVSETPVTPSIIIDKVWHEHMTYTREYWDVLCKDILGKPLHHEPGRTPADTARHTEQFQKTRALYVLCFDQTPPDEFWATSRPSTLRKRLTLLAASGVTILVALATGRTDVMVGSLLLVVVIWEMGGMPLFVMNTNTNQSGGRGRANCANCGSSCGGGGCGGD